MLTVKIKKDFRGLDALDKHVPNNVDATTYAVASAIVDDIRDNWSETSPSAPGEPPAVVTGKLDRSVSADRQGRGMTGVFASGKDVSIWIVRVMAEYAGALEHGTPAIAPRPFLLPAVMRQSETLADAYKGVFDIRW